MINDLIAGGRMTNSKVEPQANLSHKTRVYEE